MERLAPISSINLFFWVIFGFIFGILISSYYSISPLIALLVIVVSGLILGVEKFYSCEINKEALVLCLTLISLASGVLRYAIKDFHELKIPSDTGLVVSEPEDKENSRRFILLTENGEKVLVSTSLYSPIEYGGRIKVAGKLERPGLIKAENGGRDFNYAQFLAKDDIFYTLSFAEIEVLEKGKGQLVKAALLKLKESFIKQSQLILPEPQAGLLTGLLVAGRGTLPSNILEQFRRAGVIHIVVLSGFNITLIAEFLRRAFSFLFLRLKWTRYPFAPVLTSITGVLLFVIMTGGEATVVRAALMSLTVIVASLFGRSYSASRALLFAGFLMLLENPKILVFDPSFQLSFLATLGLIFVMPSLEKFFKFITNKWQFREILAQTLATQITVLPLLVHSVGDISLVSLPANLLILLVVPGTMFVGFLAVLVSYLNVALAWPIAFLTNLLLRWILWVSHFLSSLSFATFAIPTFNGWIIVALYLVLALIVFGPKFSTYPLILKKSSEII